MSDIDTQMIDQQGVGYVSQAFARLKCGFNEYTREVGIDGIVEIRDSDYKSSGKLLAVQIKSGDSFFRNENEESYLFYADLKHVEYWLRCNLPVLIILYSPSQNEAYWEKIDKASLSMKKSSYLVSVPKKRKLSCTDRDDLYSVFYGRLYSETDEFDRVLDDLMDVRYYERNDLFISGLELFLNGLIDTCNQLYFHTDIFMDTMGVKIRGTDLCGFSVPSSSSFFDDYFHVLNYHNLLTGGFAFEVETLREREMLPQFIKPLSLNGHRFLEHLRTRDFEVHVRTMVALDLPTFDPFVLDTIGEHDAAQDGESAGATSPPVS